MRTALFLAALTLTTTACGGGATESESETRLAEVSFSRPLTVVGAARWARSRNVVLEELRAVYRSPSGETSASFFPRRHMTPRQIAAAFEAELAGSRRGVTNACDPRASSWPLHAPPPTVRVRD